jgi:tetratricopeptide (TPR) repeat protein
MPTCLRAIKALEIFIVFDDRLRAASTYHGLGMAAQEQRRFADAEAAYNKALEIFIAFDDRHGAAGIYHQLGRVAQLQRRFAEAEDAYNKALEIYVAFDAPHNAGIALRSFARLWAATDAPSIPSAVAKVLNIPADEAKKLLEELRDAGNAPPPAQS